MLTSVSAGKHVHESTSVFYDRSVQALHFRELRGRMQGIYCAATATLSPPYYQCTLTPTAVAASSWLPHHSTGDTHQEAAVTVAASSLPSFLIIAGSVLYCFLTLWNSKASNDFVSISELSSFLLKNIYNDYCYLQLNPKSQRQ